MIHPTFSQWNLAHKRVFLRADLNVPLDNGTIRNDFRLKSILPTIDFLIKNNANIVLATHIGRPKNNEAELSTRILLPWFQQHGYTIRFASNVTEVTQAIIPQEIILLENLRFFPGEQDNYPVFAQQLAHTATYYINDAFGIIHENACSIATVPFLFPENKRSIGLLMEKELSILYDIKHNPQHPFIAILGGKKIKDKIPLINGLLNTADTLLLCPAICFSFLKTLKQPIGKSLVDDTLLATCKQIMLQAEKNNIPYIFPADYYITYDTVNGPLSLVDAATFPDNAIGIAIGPQTVAQFTTIINHAKTIFFNCAMGFAESPETQKSTKQIITAMAQSSARTIIAGGDSVDIALQTPYHERISHLSTGGGATLAYLGNTLLPGLIPFEEQ